MQVRTHKNARTTFAIRQEIKGSKEGITFLSKKYNLCWATVKKWKASESLEDKSSRPDKLRTTLTEEQEDRICFERKQFKKTLDDIYFTLEGEVPDLYLMKIYRCLRRHNLSVIPFEFTNAERDIKKFRKYKIGYLHIDLLYAPKINKERKYLYTAIDRTGKLGYIMFGKSKSKETGAKFLKRVLAFYPYKVNYILTDNGFEFCYKALPKHKQTKKTHPFDKICLDNKIEHRTIKFKHPWTNGMVERFNRTIKDNVLRKYMFSSILEMEQKTIDFVNRYNFEKRLKSLNYKTPKQYLEERNIISLQPIVI